MNTDIFTQNSAQDVPLDTLDKEMIAQEAQESILRRVVKDMLLNEDMMGFKTATSEISYCYKIQNRCPGN